MQASVDQTLTDYLQYLTMQYSILRKKRSFVRRMVSRARIYLRYLSSFYPVTLGSAVNLYLSSLFDIFLYTLSDYEYNPKIICPAVYYIKSRGIYVYVRGGTDDLYHCLPGRERDVEELVGRLLKPGDTFIDVGANVGYYTLLASKKVSSNGLVVSLEPIPETFSVLLRNIRLNDAKNVVPLRKAGWSSDARVKMCVPAGWYGLSTAFYEEKAGCREVMVDAIPIDKVTGDVHSVKLIKIDAEGSELEVLKGLSKTLEKTRFVILEASRKPAEIFSYLSSKGFKLKKLRFTSYVLAYKV